MHVVLKDGRVALAARKVWGVGYSGGQKLSEPVHWHVSVGLRIAQLVEHHPSKVTVVGSIPITLKNAKTGAAATRGLRLEKVSNS